MTPPSADPAALTARVEELEAALASTGELLAESLTALQIAIDDEAAGWIRLDATEDSVAFPQVKEIAHRAYEAYHMNPLIRRAVDITTAYVWGRGVTMASPQFQVQAAITDFLDEPTNAAELGHVGRMEKEKSVRLQGQLFLALYTDRRTGEVRVRTIPLAEIDEAVYDPDDYRVVRFFARTLPGGKGLTIYHPAFGYAPESKPTKVNDHAVLWDAPVLHAPLPRVCREPWAIPDVASALIWSRTYSRFLQNIASINAALSQIALLATGKNPAATAVLASLFNTGASKPAIPTASTAVLPDGAALTPFKTAGITTSADEARRYMLMVCAATGVPEHILQGDPATGNLATSKTMERPFELVILDRQLWWADLLETILYYVIEQRAMAPDCKAISGRMDEDDFGRRQLIVVGATRRVMRKPAPTEEPGEEPEEEPGEEPPAPGMPAAPPAPPKPKPVPEPVEESADEPPEISVTFPSVLEHDMAVEVTAVIDAATMAGKKPAGIMDWPTLQKLMLSALNVPDVDDLIADMDAEDIADQRTPAAPPAFGRPPGAAGEEPGAAEPGAAEEAADRAWGGLIGALREVGRRARGG